ncbi:MAG: hypothetical protein ACAH59_13650 [Pseudobdellovibrionaceae bacterium]
MMQKIFSVIAIQLPLSAMALPCETFPMNLKPDSASIDSCAQLGFVGAAHLETCEAKSALLKSPRGEEFTLTTDDSSLWSHQSVDVDSETHATALTSVTVNTAKKSFQASFVMTDSYGHPRSKITCGGQISPL